MASCTILLLLVLTLSQTLAANVAARHVVSDMIAVSNVTVNTTALPPMTNPDKHLGEAAIYTMTNTFLQIVQLSYLTDIDAELGPFSTASELLESFPVHWDKWLVYFIGFTICAAVGVTLFIVMILAGPIVACCRCCSCCSRRCRKTKGAPKPPTCCRFFSCTMFMSIVTVGVLLGTLTMFASDDRLYEQISRKAFEDLNTALIGMEHYLDGVVGDVYNKVYVDYVNTADATFAQMKAIPSDVVMLVENNTGIWNALMELSNFTNNLPQLQNELITVDVISSDLANTSAHLAVELDTLKTLVLAALNNCTSSTCLAVNSSIAAMKTVANFTVDVTDALVVVNASVEAGMDTMVKNLITQLTTFYQDLNTTIMAPIVAAEQESDRLEAELLSTIETVQQTLNDINMEISNIQSKIITGVESGKDFKLVVTIIYWSLLVMCIIMAVIVGFNIIGLLFGTLLSYKKSKSSCCSCTKAIGAHWMIASAALIFIFYWIYVIFLTVTFVGGGIIHTEFCRHVIGYENNEKSRNVLGLFDRYVNNKSEGKLVSVFGTYQRCADNYALYSALFLDEKFNLTANITGETIEEGVKKITEVPIIVPPVNLTNILTIVINLDTAFGASGLNFTAIYSNVNQSIVEPDLGTLANELRALENETGVNSTEINIYADELRRLDIVVTDAEKQQALLMESLQTAEQIVTGISFAEIALALTRSENFVNTEANATIDAYVDNTATSVGSDLVVFATGMANTIQNDLARCRPFYDSLSWIFDIACVHVLYPLNAFWFSIGWCAFFLLPSVVMSFKLADIYRTEQQATTNTTSQSSSGKAKRKIAAGKYAKSTDGKQANSGSSANGDMISAGEIVNPAFELDVPAPDYD